MRIPLVMLCALGLGLAPATARAIEVMCEDAMGRACTLNNDPSQMFDCTCDGAPAGGTTGGSENPWADYDEAELLAACEELLAMTTCGGDSTTGGGGSDEVGDTGPATITDSSPTTDPSGPEGETMPESDDGSSGSGDDGEDDDDKGCRVGNRGAVSPWLALLLVTAWRRRAITSAAG